MKGKSKEKKKGKSKAKFAERIIVRAKRNKKSKDYRKCNLQRQSIKALARSKHLKRETIVPKGKEIKTIKTI